MAYIVVDVEADGPAPGIYSMVSFGAVYVADLTKTFYGKVKPISDIWIPDALAISNITREEHLTYDNPKIIMEKFDIWIKEITKESTPIFCSDNNGFDFAFINYYFHKYLGRNPFGFSSRRIGDLYCGLVKHSRARWKHLRDSPHNHNPISDATGNAEVLLHMRDNMGLNIKFD